MMKTQIKCLVTGGAGFIGSHLCDVLLAKGYEVYCLDNLITGSRKNIFHLLPKSNFHFLLQDISKPLSSTLNYQLSTINYIYHLASPASPPQYRKYAIETLLVNSIGTYNMLELAKSAKANFLLASTSEVYGNPLLHPQKESYFGNVNPVGVRACYDESKRFAEAITLEYVRKFKVRARIIRIFNTYGPRMQPQDGRVISNFITAALGGKSLQMYGDGKQTRSFCYVSDMVSGIVMACEREGIDGKVINLGNTDERTIKEIGLKILKLTGSDSSLIESEKQEDDPQMRKPDISRAIELLDWQPKVDLNTGLRQTIKYFKNL